MNLLEDTKKLLDALPPLVNCWIAGGAARDIFLEQDFTADIDVFFKHSEAAGDWIDHLRNKGYPEKSSTYARTFTVPYKNTQIELQIVELGYWDNLEQLFDDFDWTVCQFSYDSDGLYFRIRAVQDLMKNELHWCKIKSGYGGVMRMIKYVNKGYTLSEETVKEFLRAMVDCPPLIEKEWKNQ